MFHRNSTFLNELSAFVNYIFWRDNSAQGFFTRCNKNIIILVWALATDYLLDQKISHFP